MKKYILTKHETVTRTERVEYGIEIPESIKNKTGYANDQILKNNYMNCRIADVVGSELIDEEIINLKKNNG